MTAEAVEYDGMKSHTSRCIAIQRDHPGGPCMCRRSSPVEEVKPTLDQLRQYAVAVGLIPPDAAPTVQMLDILNRQVMAAWALLPVGDAQSEREACAKLCEMVGDKKEGHSLGYRSAAWECRDLIRGRGANRA
jgi:hypothetical protein